MNLGFNQPWTKGVLALGFDKPVSLHQGLPRTGLRFCELVRLTKCRPWVCQAFGETTRELSVLGFWRGSLRADLGLTSVVCAVCMSCSCIHVIYEVACTGVVVSCSCIRVTHGVVSTGDMVVCSCIHITHGVVHTGDIVACSCICGTCEVARTRDFGVMLLHTWHL